VLELKSLSKQFGGVRAVDGLDLTVNKGEIFGLIGPNGSGKSTTVNLITGLFFPTGGQILLEGNDISRLPPHRTLEQGIARTFQNIRLFEQLTVWQNLWVSLNAAQGNKRGFFGTWLAGPRKVKEELHDLLTFSGLGHKADELAGNLAFGEQRRLELARAIAARPKLLLLDEPAAGMNLEEVGQLDERLRVLNKQGMTILLVEHVMELVMGVTDRIVVLNFGRKIAEGTPAEIQANDMVKEAYLGSDASIATADGESQNA